MACPLRLDGCNGWHLWLVGVCTPHAFARTVCARAWSRPAHNDTHGTLTSTVALPQRAKRPPMIRHPVLPTHVRILHAKFFKCTYGGRWCCQRCPPHIHGWVRGAVLRLPHAVQQVPSDRRRAISRAGNRVRAAVHCAMGNAAGLPNGKGTCFLLPPACQLPGNLCLVLFKARRLWVCGGEGYRYRCRVPWLYMYAHTFGIVRTPLNVYEHVCTTRLLGSTSLHAFN